MPVHVLRGSAMLIAAVPLLALAAIAPAAEPAQATPAGADWKPLFNGKNFDGWYILQEEERRS